MYSEITKQAENIANEIIEKAKLKKGQILVVGCSSSEVCGDKIGSNSNLEVAKALFKGLYSVLEEKGIYLAAQCCEHLNRAIVVEREAVPLQKLLTLCHSQRQVVLLELRRIRHLRILLWWKK